MQHGLNETILLPILRMALPEVLLGDGSLRGVVLKTNTHVSEKTNSQTNIQVFVFSTSPLPHIAASHKWWTPHFSESFVLVVTQPHG